LNMTSILPRFAFSVHSALWAIAQNCLLRYGPLRRIFICAMGHRPEYGLALWATAQNFVKHCGPQHWICLESDTNQIPCIHIHVAVYPHVHDCISTCMWPCIYVHVTIYPWACGRVSTGSCIHMQVVVYPHQNLAMRYGPQCRIWLSTVGLCTEFC
jgi:hypothetical protein